MGWLAGWDYRKEITVTNNVASTLTNFQAAIDLDLLEIVETGKAKADLTDLRVTDSDGSTLLNFYRETTGNNLGNFNNWNRWQENPVLSPGAGGAWDDFWIHPHSMINNGGTLYLYYGGSGDTSTSPTHTGLATSSDGISWTKSGSNPIFSPGTGGEWDDAKVDHFSVLKEGSSWYAWYAGNDGSVWKIGYATSSDGISWTRSGSNPVLAGTGAAWDSAGVQVSQVWKESSTYYMLYWGYTDAGDSSTWKIGLATSSDRVTWSKSGSNPVFAGATGQWDDGVLDCHAVKIGSTYYMFYQGNTDDGNNSSTGLATSTNLTTWSRDADNPISRGANSGEWDVEWCEGPLLYQMTDGTWWMYYMGSKGGGTELKHIGVMKFKPTRLWVEVPSIPSSSTATVYVYYGKSDAADASSGANTFLFFDDFTGGTPFSQWTNSGSLTGATDAGDDWAAKYAANTSANYLMISSSTFAPPFVAECRAKVGTNWASEYGWNYQLAIVDSPGASWNGVEFGHYKDGGNDNYYFRRFSGGSATHTDIQARAIHAYVATELTIRVASSGSLVGKCHDGYRTHSIAQNPPAATFALQVLTGRGATDADYTTYFDKTWIREYATTDPSASAGTEEEATTIQPSSIASAEAFGVPILSGDVAIIGAGGIATGEAFGSPTVDENTGEIVDAGDIASAQAFGTPSVVLVISPSSIASAEAFGSPYLGELVTYGRVSRATMSARRFVFLGAAMGNKFASYWNSGTQTISNGVDNTSIIVDTEKTDENNLASISGGNVAVAATGWYLVFAQLQVTAGAALNGYLRFYHNGYAGEYQTFETAHGILSADMQVGPLLWHITSSGTTLPLRFDNHSGQSVDVYILEMDLVKLD